MSNINLNNAMQTLNVGQRWGVFTGVSLLAGQSESGETLEYFVGTDGNVLEVDVPGGTRQMAQTILDGLKKRGYRYQPFESANTVTDPAIEIGDPVSVNSAYSTIMSVDLTHSRLMASTLKAPYDEEVDHEFKFEPRTTREYKRETAYARSRLSLNESEIRLEVARATNKEGELAASLAVTASAITAEVSRATAEEGRLSSRITVTSDAIESEVTRATGAESRIEQKADSITLTVSNTSGQDGYTTFTLTNSSGFLRAQNFDLKVLNTNIVGKLTVGQIASGSVVTSTKTETEYYLSTSSSSATGGSWSTTVPTWASGKYIWTRTKTTSTKNDQQNDTVTYSPSQNGAYDKNLTEALSTASSASSTAGTANTNALSATKRTQTIYKSAAAGASVTAPTSWVTDVTGNQNTWTAKRPANDPNYGSGTHYPALYIAQQSETVGGTVTCTTPKLDATTTVIDGANIVTGSISANKLSVTDLYAIGATIGGWTIASTMLEKGGGNDELYRVRISSLMGGENYNAIVVAARATTSDSFDTKFSVTYGGKLYAKNAEISGKITATSGTIGGVSISGGVLTGISSANIQDRGITGTDIGIGTITGGTDTTQNYSPTGNLDRSSALGVGLGNAYGLACNQYTTEYPGIFTCGTLDCKYEIVYTDPNWASHGVRWHSTNFLDGNGNTVYLTYLGSDNA